MKSEDLPFADKNESLRDYGLEVTNIIFIDMVMNIYHLAYSQYIAHMNQLKGDVMELACKAADSRRNKDKALDILSDIDETIYTASAEVFPPSGGLLKITQAVQSLKADLQTETPAVQSLFKPCFRALSAAASALRRIADDSSLRAAAEISAQEMS